MEAARQGNYDKIYRQRLYDTFLADSETIKSFSVRKFLQKHFFS